MESINHYFTKVWGIILAVAPFALILLPSLITGLSSYPKASGVVSFLRALVDFFSWATHKDSPGTFKLPFTLSPAPPPEKPVVNPYVRGAPPPSGRTLLSTLAFLLLATSLIACASWRAFWRAEKDCSKSATVQASIERLMPTVTKALELVVPDRAAQLEQLVRDFGPDIECVWLVATKHWHGPDLPMAPTDERVRAVVMRQAAARSAP